MYYSSGCRVEELIHLPAMKMLSLLHQYVSINIFIYETHNEISYHAVYAPSKDSDQHAHMSSLE